MAYQVLARRWRPRRFAEVVGQEHVTRTLSNAIRAGRLAHGFLFCGPRGVGKTTTARILAKCLNCETAQEGPVVDPCNECASCREISDGVNLDVLEIDGASNRGIDEIRELRENVRYAPSGGRAKVYIIDEVHMLTKEAFNALLKTLEEPPPGVYFVFATTEAHKVPATIRSRCQQYDFHRIPAETIVKTLENLAERENFEIEPLAVAELARQADGGLRDAQSLLDQASAASEGKITLDAVKALLGETSEEATLGIIEAVVGGSPGKALVGLQELLDRGTDPGRIAVSITQTLRDLLVVRSVPGDALRLGVRADLVDSYRALTERVTESQITGLLALASRTVSDLRRSSRPRLILEVALARMGRLEDPGELAELAGRLESLQDRLGAGGGGSGGSGGSGDAVPARRSAPASSNPPPGTAGPPPAGRPSRRPSGPPKSAAPPPVERRRPEEPPHPADAADRPPPPAEPPPGEEGPAEPASSAAPPAGKGSGDSLPDETGRIWADLLGRVRNRKRMLGSFLEHGAPVGLDRDVLSAVFDSNYYEGMVKRPENLALIQEELAAAAGRPLSFHPRVGSLPGGARSGAAEGGSDPESGTPRGRESRDILSENPGLNRVIHDLGGRLLSGGDPTTGGGE